VVLGTAQSSVHLLPVNRVHSEWLVIYSEVVALAVLEHTGAPTLCIAPFVKRERIQDMDIQPVSLANKVNIQTESDLPNAYLVLQECTRKKSLPIADPVNLTRLLMSA